MYKNKIKILLYWIIALLLSILPFYNMVINGVYKWHISQPEVYEGMLEVIIFFIFTLLMSCFFTKNSIKFILFSVIIYFCKHGVIIPIMTDYMYFEILSYIGFVISSFKNINNEDSIIWNFITGCSIWGTFAVTFSAFGKGTINDLRIVTLLLLFFSMILRIKIKNVKYKLILFRLNDFYIDNIHTKTSKIIFIAIIFILSILCAKSNTALDYDSLWYGLRPEMVLVGNNSFYDYLGYTSFVHYYPKLMELLFLPISGLGDYSFLICMNIGCLAFISVVICKILSILLPSYSKTTHLFILLLLYSIPAISNIAATAKPDILGCLFVLVAFYYGLRYYLGEENRLVYSYSALLLCTGTKPTYILWGGILFVFLTVLFVARSLKQNLHFKKVIQSSAQEKVTIIATILFVIGVHARTYLLTGYPIYPMGINLFNKMGFFPKNYALSETIPLSTDGVNFLKRIYQFIFDPVELPHVIMLWTSNVLLYIVILFVTNYKKESLNKERLGLQFYATFLIAISLCIIATMTNPDGNYFIFPIIVSSIIFFSNAINMTKIDKSKSYFFPLWLIILINMVLMFVSHPSWAYGTKSFDFQVISDNFDSDERDNNLLSYNGVYNIASYLESHHSSERFLSSTLGNASIPRRIHSRIETIDMIYTPYFNGGHIFDSYSNFQKYISEIPISGFIIGNDEEGIYKEYINQLEAEGKVILAVQDTSACLYLLTHN